MTKVLIIEDDLSMRSLLKTLLEIENFQVNVLEVNNPVDLVSQIQNSDPDVILMDVNLKSTDGLAILRQIRHGAPEQKKFRVIMTSGEDKKQECLMAGADEFLLKPYMPTDLIQKLKLHS
jgi:DNA-binding response OmpR family regulator